jgi:hypothetical protein
MDLWLLHKELEMINLPAESIKACQMQICRAITDSFNRGELAASEAVAMITEIINPL